MRTIGLVTFARSEYSSCRPVVRAIQACPELELQLLVGGAHLSPEFGYTVSEIEADGVDIDARIEMLLASDTPEGTAKSVALGVIGLAQRFSQSRPDILLLVGDRIELLAAACAASAFRIPMAHLSGGDITEGAIDNQVRHAITKMSHIHFVSMQAHADRVIQMGEESWRVVVAGDPALDEVRHMQLLNRSELVERLGMTLDPPVILATYHPTTLSSMAVLEEINHLLAALSETDGTILFSYPNADPGSRAIIDRIRDFVQCHANSRLFHNLGQPAYYSLLNEADLMVGNSSSGIWEAPSFRLPVVNVGDRQRGRLRAGNVIDVDCLAEAIHQGIQLALDDGFRVSLSSIENPYGDGQAARRIVDTLVDIELGPRLLQKRFADVQMLRDA